MKIQLRNCLLFFITVFILGSCSNIKDEIKLIPIKAGDKWGYVDKKGNYVINSQFEDAYNFSEGLALCRSTEGKYGFVGEDGKYAINPIYKDATSFSEGLACVIMENGKPQFINKEGKILFTVDKAEFCFAFTEDRAQIKVKGKWGYIDKTGKIVVSPIYDNANRYSEGLAAVSKIDEKTKEEKWGFIDKNGSVKISFQFVGDKDKLYCQPEGFKEDLAFVSSDGKQWGCISVDGKYQVNPQFEATDFNTYGFKNGVSLISQGGSFGYIDKNGKYIVNPQFKGARDFASNGLAAVEHSDGKWGFINKEGKYEINPQFESVSRGFIDDIAFVQSSDKYGIIDKKGLYILNPQFDEVKLWDLGVVFGAKSDYVDNEAIAEQLFPNSNSSNYLGYNQWTTLGQIIDEYPNKSIDDLKPYNLTIDHPKISISDMIKIGTLNFGFKEKTYSETPIYKNVQKYSSYYGYYNSKEIDKWDKKPMSESPLSFTTLGFKLKSEGKGKGKALADAIKNQAIKILKVSSLGNTELKNSENKGLYLLSNDNFLIYLTYSQKEDEVKDNPSLTLSVVNKNYEKGFEELAKQLADDFK